VYKNFSFHTHSLKVLDGVCKHKLYFSFVTSFFKTLGCPGIAAESGKIGNRKKSLINYKETASG
jgi:hypothetical protein